MVAQTPVADLGGVRAGLLDVLAWVLAAFSTILPWPVHALIRKIRGKKNKTMTASLLEAAPVEARATSHTEP